MRGRGWAWLEDDGWDGHGGAAVGPVEDPLLLGDWLGCSKGGGQGSRGRGDAPGLRGLEGGLDAHVAEEGDARGVGERGVEGRARVVSHDVGEGLDAEAVVQVDLRADALVAEDGPDVGQLRGGDVLGEVVDDVGVLLEEEVGEQGAVEECDHDLGAEEEAVADRVDGEEMLEEVDALCEVLDAVEGTAGKKIGVSNEWMGGKKERRRGGIPGDGDGRGPPEELRVSREGAELVDGLDAEPEDLEHLAHVRLAERALLEEDVDAPAVRLLGGRGVEELGGAGPGDLLAVGRPGVGRLSAGQKKQSKRGC